MRDEYLIQSFSLRMSSGGSPSGHRIGMGKVDHVPGLSSEVMPTFPKR